MAAPSKRNGIRWPGDVKGEDLGPRRSWGFLESSRCPGMFEEPGVP